MNPIFVTPLQETINANGNPNTMVLQEISPFFGLSWENLILIAGGLYVGYLSFNWHKRRRKSYGGIEE